MQVKRENNDTYLINFSLRLFTQLKVIKVWYYEVGSECRAKEKEILTKYKEFKYTGAPLLSSGNTELFSEDILCLDT